MLTNFWSLKAKMWPCQRKMVNYCNFSSFSSWQSSVAFPFSKDSNFRAKVWQLGQTAGTKFTTFNQEWQLSLSSSFPSLTHTSAAFTLSLPPTISLFGFSSRSGGDHAFAPFAVGHCAAVVVWHTALVSLLFASVQECLQGLSLAFGFAHHVTGTLWLETGRREIRREADRGFIINIFPLQLKVFF